jgi:hypothetical protein
MDFIFEFGGGYGNMCRLLHKLRFQGRYVLFDLPAFSALQKFYLESAGLTVHPVGSFEKERKGCFCISEMEQLKYVLSSGKTNNSMFIATWSISETPLELRNNVLPHVKDFGAFLIAYQSGFKEIDNLSYFQEWTKSLNNIDWQDTRIEIMKHHNRYLFGTSKP